ncbi:TlpA family protein disulfide reductase [Roseivirga pacifica]|uniref:TlpA family protein disulfide reductase n=1 Tax=Roseivirga pacifica TaxID=1267423 RepID=UPI003BB176EE
MNNKSLLFLFLILIVACNTEAENTLLEPSAEKQPNEAVVIISNSTDSPISIELLDSVTHLKDEWYTTYRKINTFSLKLKKTAKATIYSLESYPEERFISPGDTLNIDLKASQIQVQSTDRLNAQEIIEERSEELLETDSLYNQFILLHDSSMLMRGRNDLSLFQGIPVHGNKALLKEKPALLDELVNRLMYQLEFVPTPLTEISNPELEDVHRLKYEIEREEAFIRLRLLTSQLDRPDIHDMIFDSNLYQAELALESPFLYGYLVFFIKEYVLQGVEDRSSNKAYVDYKLAYDRLPKFVEGELLEATREICLEKMVSYNESSLSLKSYLSKFLADHQHSAFVASFEERYLLAYGAEINSTADLMLMSNAGSMLTLSELVEAPLDSTQLYYVDFWASWCAPCRQAMPFSEEKRALFEDKGVKFIYLSMDRDKQKWETASLSHHLETYEHSYLLINPEAQQFIKDLKIDFIPRYIILNSEGKVIEDNAPGPEGERLDEVLLEYLGS